ncbi:MAG: DNA translocase FtsK [Spirochaetes bacterium]|nr:DNA translocase FtsK [Spirochaetota bacterium]
MTGQELKNLIGIILITFSLFIIFFFIDGVSNELMIFGDFSFSFAHFMINQIGVFPLFVFSIGLCAGLLLLFPVDSLVKICTFSGYLLLITFLPPFFHTVTAQKVSGGYFGAWINNHFMFSGFGYLLLFFWFFLAFFLLLYPFKNFIVQALIFIFAGSQDIFKQFTVNRSLGKEKIPRKKKSDYSISGREVQSNKGNNKSGSSHAGTFSLFQLKEEKKSHGKKKINKFDYQNVPWISKVVYESPERRVEVPVFPVQEKIVKKFKLKEQTEQKEDYEEVDTFSGVHPNPIYEEIAKNKDQYYEKLKQDWPNSWKEEQEGQSEEPVLEITDSAENNQAVEAEAFFENDVNNLPVAIEYLEAEPQEELIEDNQALLEDENLTVDFEQMFDTQKSVKKQTYQPQNLPKSNLLPDDSKKQKSHDFKKEEREAAEILESTLMEFGIEAEVCDIVHGPVVTLFKLIPAPGIRLSKIEGLSNNLALRLAAKSIRIIAPIPGEKVVGIEIPNSKRQLIAFNEVVNCEEFTESGFQIPIGLGKDIYGKIITIDLYKMPHILIAGATGAGKSVCVNSFLSSILFSKTPEELRVILIDPKIVELKPYNNIPHLLTPVITDAKKAIIALKYLIFEMERRYSLLDQMGVRDIVEYQRLQKKKKHMENLPFIVTFVDEFADLMSISGKEAELLFARLTAKARAVGLHLVLATQRPSTDVITGLIKANVPARIAFQVISLQDSRIILDQKGAEKLLGQGDMLYLSPTQPFPIRLQGAFLSKEDVDLIADHWKNIANPDYLDLDEILGVNEENDEISGDFSDPLYEEAEQIVMQSRKASASYLQRRLNIGYNRAARLVEEMEARGIVGPMNGSKPREVIG